MTNLRPTKFHPFATPDLPADPPPRGKSGFVDQDLGGGVQMYFAHPICHLTKDILFFRNENLLYDVFYIKNKVALGRGGDSPSLPFVINLPLPCGAGSFAIYAHARNSSQPKFQSQCCQTSAEMISNLASKSSKPPSEPRGQFRDAPHRRRFSSQPRRLSCDRQTKE